MSGFDTTLDVLIESRNVDAPRLLSHVLTRGEMPLRRRAVERLIATKNGRSQVLLVRHFAYLGNQCERLVYDSIASLGPGLRAAMGSRDPRLQRTVVELIRDTEEFSLTYLCGEATHCSDEQVRGLAVDVLWRRAVELRREEMAHDEPAEVMLDESWRRRRGFVLEGLQKAFATRWAGESPRVLRATAMLADRTTQWFWGAMAVRTDTRRLVLLRSLHERLDVHVFSFLVRALEREGVASEAVELLQRTFPRDQLEALLKEFHRSGPLSPAAAKRLTAMPWLGAGEAALEELPSNQVAVALALAVSSGMSRKQLAVVSRGIAVNHGEKASRRIALETLEHCAEAADEELRVVALTAPQPTAGLAILALTRRGALDVRDENTASRLMDNLLRDWADLTGMERREVGRGLTAALRERPNLLRHHLIGGSRTRRVAVDLVRQAQVADVYGEQLKVLATSSDDTQLQSAALYAVAEGPSREAGDLLEAALNSWDARVRANALEALDRREVGDGVFLRFTRDPNPRVRANVARALIHRGRDEGRQVLEQMLSGDEAERISGLWAFSRTHPEGFSRTAQMLAEQDPSQRVRQKAAELLATA